MVPRTAYEFKRDRLGRPFFFADPPARLERAPVVQIRLEHEGKTYRAVERPTLRGSAEETPSGGALTPETLPGRSAVTEASRPLPSPAHRESRSVASTACTARTRRPPSGPPGRG